MSAPLGSGSNPQTMRGIHQMRAPEGGDGDGEDRPWKNGGRIKALLVGMPIATLLLMLTNMSVFIYQLTRDEASNENVICVAPVIYDHEYWRVYTAAFFHGGFFHVGMNMLALYQLGSSLEDSLGTLTLFGLCSILFPIFVGLQYIFFEYMWATIMKDSQYLLSCALGYSGVIFGLLVIDTGLAIKRGEHTRRLFGCTVPTFLYPIAMLLAISLVMPNISFVGHLSGIVIGLLYVRGFLLLFTLPRQWLLAIENCLPSWLVHRPGWRPMPREDMFADWHPLFCRSNSFCPDAPNVDGGCSAMIDMCLTFLHLRRQRRSRIPGVGAGYRLDDGAPPAARASNAGRPVSRLVAPSAPPPPPAALMQPAPTSGASNLIERPPSPSQLSVPARPSSEPLDHLQGVQMGEGGASTTGGHYARLEVVRHRVFGGVSLPFHEEELTITSDRIVWRSGINIQTSNDKKDRKEQLGVRTLKSLSLPSSRTAAFDRVLLGVGSSGGSGGLSGAGGVEAIVRGGCAKNGHIIDAQWATFANFKQATPERQLCILQQECLYILNSEGELASVQLPAKAKAMWVLLEGILIERESDPNYRDHDPLSEYDDADDDDPDRLSPSSGGSVPPAPMFFSLLHPLEELKPVSKVEPIQDEEAQRSLSEEEWIQDQNETIIYTCPQQPFVITYHTIKQRHSLWLIRQSRREVWNRMKLDGTAGPSIDVASPIPPVRTDSTIPLPSSSSSVGGPSRRASTGWHGPTSHTNHQLTPTHPSHTQDKKKNNNEKDFYQQFLRSSLDSPSNHSQPAYHTAAAPSQLNSDDSSIHSELLFERSWIEPIPSPHPASYVFLACDEFGRPLLCMFTDVTHTLQVYYLTSSIDTETQLPSLHIQFAWTKHCKSAKPIYMEWHNKFVKNENPYNYGMILLELDGSMNIYIGETRFTNVRVSFGSISLTPNTTPNDAALSCVTMHRGGAVAATPIRPTMTQHGGDSIDDGQQMDISFESNTSSAFFSPQQHSVFARTPGLNTTSGGVVGLVGGVGRPVSTDVRANEIVRLLDPVSNRLTLETGDGTLYRLSIPTHHLSPIVHKVMSALACALTPMLTLALRSDIVTLRNEVAIRTRSRSNMNATSCASANRCTISPNGDDEWCALVELVRWSIGYESNRHSSPLTPVTTPTPIGEAAWKKLLSSRFHRAHIKGRKEDEAQPSSSSSSNRPSIFTADDWRSFSLSTSPSALLVELPQLFLTLHLLYEDFKLVGVEDGGGGGGGGQAEPALLTPAQRIATQLLRPIAIAIGRWEYVDAYRRDSMKNAGLFHIDASDLAKWRCALNASSNALSSTSLAVVPTIPPSIHAFLIGLLRHDPSSTGAVYPLPVVSAFSHARESSESGSGSDVTDSIDTNRPGHHFLLENGFDEPFAWTRKILLFYDLLTRRTDSNSTVGVGAVTNRTHASAALPSTNMRPATAAAAAVATNANANSTLPSVDTPHLRAIYSSDFGNSPYALPNIELRQVEHAVRHAPIHSRGWSTSAAAATSELNSTINIFSTPGAPLSSQHHPAHVHRDWRTPHRSPIDAAILPPTITASNGTHVMLSPVLTSPFPTALSPFNLKHSASSTARLQQHRRVQSMQLAAVAAAAAAGKLAAASAANGGGRSVAGSPASNAQTAGEEPHTPYEQRKRPRVSFGANTTVGTVCTLASSGSMRLAAVASDYPIFTPSTLPHATPLFLSHSAAESVVLAMVAEDVTLDHIGLLPIGIALPLLECLKTVREHPPVNLGVRNTPTLGADPSSLSPSSVELSWPREAYLLIGREDLGTMFSSSVAPSSTIHDKSHLLAEELELASGRPQDTELESVADPSSAAAASSSSSVGSKSKHLLDAPDLDGTLQVQKDSMLRFGQDLRLKEVRHLLRSDRILCVSLDASIRQEIDAGQAEQSSENQIRLGIVAKRALSLPIARGMYTLSSITPILTESLPIPPFVLRGRLPPLNGLIDLDLSPGNPSGLSQAHLNWPDFHNGVAAALRVHPAHVTTLGGNKSRDTHHTGGIGATLTEEDTNSSPMSTPLHAESLHQITRTWIMYNRPSLNVPSAPVNNTTNAPTPPKGGLSYSHAGFLFGLGLTGHLNCLTASDFFWYLSQNHEPTAVAMLLGMAACRRGTMDTLVSKMLTLHVPALLPHNFSEMNIPSVVQSSALLGLGLLYQGSCHRLMCEILLNEIGRRPDRYKSDESFLLERENYSLSAGLGLGLLLLGKGADAHAMSTLSDLMLERRLSLYIHGGPDVTRVGGGGGSGGGIGSHHLTDDATSMFDGSRVDWMNGVHSATRRPSSSSTTIGATSHRTNATFAAAAASAKNGRIKEGAMVNVDVTSPGATLALGLMYLQSNNSLIAARVAIPDTHFSLDYVRSDFIFLRVLARHLILWKDIPETIDQLLGTLTELLTNHVLSIRYYFPKESNDTNTNKQPRSTSKSKTAPASDGDADMHGDSDDDGDVGDEDVSDRVESAAAPHPSTPLTLPVGAVGDTSSDVDYATLRQAYLYVLSSSCFCMGLKFAGTCDSRILHILLTIMQSLRTLLKKRGGGDFVKLTMLEGLNPQSQLHKVDRGTLESALIAVANGMALLMAGSGNLKVFKIFRHLYKIRPEKTTPAGWYASISMAIGMLFLGGGRFTIDTGSGQHNSSVYQANIAYIVIALYPHLSYTIDEQRYYLSIYRHLYVLATSQRGIQTIDVDTGLPCYVPLEVIVEQGERKLNETTNGTAPKTILKRLRFMTPCLLPSYDSIHSISIVSERFHALTIQLKNPSSSTSSDRSYVGDSFTTFQHIFVKKKLAYESYELDPRGLRSILVRTFPTNHRLLQATLGREEEENHHTTSNGMGRLSKREFLRSFSTEPRLLSFTQLFIQQERGGGGVGVHPQVDDMKGSQLSEYLTDILYECLQEEKFFEMIQIYLQLFTIAHDIQQQEDAAAVDRDSSDDHRLTSKLADIRLIANLVLIKQYYDSIRKQHVDGAAGEAADQPSGGGLTSSPPSSSSSRVPINSHIPFHRLPLSECSAVGVDLDDADTNHSLHVSSSSSSSSSLLSHRRSTNPLLSLAFLDAILRRIEQHFTYHRPLKLAFQQYIRQVATSDSQQQEEENKTPMHEQNNAYHPLLGSLLLYWSIPSISTLRAGLCTLRHSLSSNPVPRSFGAPLSVTPLELIWCGLIFPDLTAAPVKAILEAMHTI